MPLRSYYLKNSVKYLRFVLSFKAHLQLMPERRLSPVHTRRSMDQYQRFENAVINILGSREASYGVNKTNSILFFGLRTTMQNFMKIE